MYKNFIKRILDFILSLIGFIILLPIFVFITFFLAIANNGKPFFFQPRPGKNANIFKVIKFKTMSNERDADGNLLPDEKRLTKVGKLIRSTSLDELPQLINVLKGDMSLVGPRPLLVQYLPLYTKEQARRHEVRPGITGWAQISGRNLMKLSKKFEYDVWYVDHASFKLDIKILFFTIKNVLRKKDVGLGAGDMEKVDDLGFLDRLKQRTN